MKLGTFAVETPVGTAWRVGVLTSAGVIDASAAAIALHERRLARAAATRVALAMVPPDMIKILETGPIGLAWVQEAVDHVLESGQGRTSEGGRTVYAFDEIVLQSPIPRPAGLTNFSAWPQHVENAGSGLLKTVEGILTYWKGNADSFVGTGVDLHLPSYATELDVECELAAVIGVASKDMSPEQSVDAIAGYTILNDVSVRDIQRREMQSGRGPAKGKDFDGGNILGPWLVTSDEVGDMSTLEMSLIVNGDVWASRRASEMALKFADMLAYLSKGQTLRPGHVVTSGCFPGGSSIDHGRKLSPGDITEARITGIGSLINRIAVEPQV